MANATVVALGGNALIRAHEHGTYDEQLRNVKVTSAALAELVKAGHRLVITHGNGPQVGKILIQQESAGDLVSPMPLDVCGAETQGQIGYLLQQGLTNALNRANIPKAVVTITTQTVIDANSPAFQKPTKPIGLFYDETTAEWIRENKGWTMTMTPRGYRRLVAHPTDRYRREGCHQAVGGVGHRYRLGRGNCREGC